MSQRTGSWPMTRQEGRDAASHLPTSLTSLSDPNRTRDQGFNAEVTGGGSTIASKSKVSGRCVSHSQAVGVDRKRDSFACWDPDRGQEWKLRVRLLFLRVLLQALDLADCAVWGEEDELPRPCVALLSCTGPKRCPNLDVDAGFQPANHSVSTDTEVDAGLQLAHQPLPMDAPRGLPRGDVQWNDECLPRGIW